MKLIGLSGLEPPTSRLSGVRSNQLSYRPMRYKFAFQKSSLKIKQSNNLFQTSILQLMAAP